MEASCVNFAERLYGLLWFTLISNFRYFTGKDQYYIPETTSEVVQTYQLDRLSGYKYTDTHMHTHTHTHTHTLTHSLTHAYTQTALRF